MVDPQKTVFVSYRRKVSRHLARSIVLDLTAHGYDVFLDVNAADNGALDRIILNQIAARPHFLCVLSRGSLERCQHEGDWVRREIEEAMRLQRNIVPIIEEGFPFEREVRKYLPQALAEDFLRLSAVRLFHDYFEAGMDRLRNQFLKNPVYGIAITPTPDYEEETVHAHVEQIKRGEISNENHQQEQDETEIVEHVAKPNYQLDAEQKVIELTEQIHRNRNATLAYYERGKAHIYLNDAASAINDFSHALHQNPEFAEAYEQRGVAYHNLKDYKRAIVDQTEAIRLKPDFAKAYYERGLNFLWVEKYNFAISDFTEAIRLKPKFAAAYRERGVAYHWMHNYQAAIADYRAAIAYGHSESDRLQKWIVDCERALT